MQNKTTTLSPLQVLYGGYPGSVRYVSGQLNRIRDITNPNGDRRDQLSARVRQVVATLMTNEIRRRDEHEAIREQRYAVRRPQTAAQAPADSELELPALFDEESPSAPASLKTSGHALSSLSTVQPRDLSLIEVEEDVLVRTRVFPRSIHCNACGHFLLLMPDRPPTTLTCPCCRNAQLVVEPIVFVCGRCATMRELCPPGERIAPPHRGRKRLKIDAQLGKPPACPECADGHIHLDKHGTNTISRWEWRCSSCTGYVEVLQEPCGMCGVPAADGFGSDYILMQALPAAASNALQPLIFQSLFVRNQEIDLASLRQHRNAQEASWPDAFSLVSALDTKAISIEAESTLRAGCLADAYLVDDVQVVTVTYGYKAGSTAGHPQTPVDFADRLAQFFRDPEGLTRYLVYCVSTQGAALVLEFDHQRIVERLSQVNPKLAGASWDDIVAAEMQTLQNSAVRDLLRTERSDLVAYRALHAIEHALLMNAIQLTGTEALASRMFFSAATIVITERSPIGRGGVIQLVNRGPGLIQLFEAARDQLLGCAQGCRDGCPSCIYVREPSCAQPVEEFGALWLPPNSLLSRRSAAAVLADGSAA
jgi:hypothetical protein